VTTAPTNPYAPSAALAEDEARKSKRPPSRLLAAATTLLALPLAGAGLYIFGRERRFRGWIAAGLCLWTTMIVAARTQLPKLFVIGFAGAVLVWLASVGDTLIAKPGTWHTRGRAWLAAVLLVVCARAGNAAVKEWLVEGFQIPSGAMIPALLVGDQIMVRKGRGSIARGDVIVFEYPRDRSTDYVSRVVALGGDRIEVKRGVPSINGVLLAHVDVAGGCPANDEPGVPPNAAGSCRLVRETNAGRAYTIMLESDHPAPDFGPMIVPADEVLVFGDNRDNSMDSRFWGGLPVDHVKGTATLTGWSKDPKTGIRWSRIGRTLE